MIKQQQQREGYGKQHRYTVSGGLKVYYPGQRLTEINHNTNVTIDTNSTESDLSA